MATHSSIFAWEIQWTEEPGRLQSRWLQRVRLNLATQQQQYVCSLRLAGYSPWGCKESDQT